MDIEIDAMYHHQHRCVRCHVSSSTYMCQMSHTHMLEVLEAMDEHEQEMFLRCACMHMFMFMSACVRVCVRLFVYLLGCKGHC